MPFVLRRLGFFVVTLWAAVSLNFVIPRLMPGNPIQALEAAHPHLDPQSIHALTVLLGGGYQGSLVSQYFTYWERVLTFNFGISITTSFGTPVSSMVMHALPWTLALVGVATVLAFILGTLIGLVSAWRRGSWLDNALPPIFVITSAFPYFWVGLILIYVFAIRLGIFPQQGAYNFLNDTPGWNGTYIVDVFEHAVLPGLTILLTAIGGWILTMRNNVITVMAEDYVPHGARQGPEAVADHVGLRREERRPPQPDRVRDVARLRGLRRHRRRVRLQLPGPRNPAADRGAGAGLPAHAGPVPAHHRRRHAQRARGRPGHGDHRSPDPRGELARRP